MKIQFDELAYQTEAIQSVIRIFEGQQIRKSDFTIAGDDKQGKLFGEKGIGNRVEQDRARMLRNVQQIQIDNGIPVSDELPGPFPQFNIEMETGTGKTFVYLKTILELNRSYGFTKFVIVVPSIAIKEGVMKTIEITKDYFKAQLNGLIYRSFMYDSKRLNEVRDFAQSESIEIMVINIQAFSKSSKNEDNMNIIYRKDMDSLFGIAPIELIAETNPVVVIDEPQSVDNTDNAKKAIAALNPAVTFRYSATHKNTDYPLLYKLGPVEAYENKLVKQIEVAGIRHNTDGNEAYIRLLAIKATKSAVTATVEMYEKSKTDITKKEIKLKQGDDLYIKSKRISTYEKLGFVKEISADPGNEYIELSGEPSIIRLRESVENDRQIKRAQIRKTIEEHLNKELTLNPLGIKVLSLFFLDNVANYRQYDEAGSPLKGEYARIFEEEYEQLISLDKYRSLRDRAILAADVHDGYFAQDGKGRLKNTSGETQADESTYQIIMKDKEDLLTFYDEEKGQVKRANKLRFIFSHSALKEGWDNPNVFQICTLIESKDTITKRQKIGRGLRIAVNQQGERVPGFEVNTLTVMANESYEDFAKGLQREYEEEGVQFGMFDDMVFSAIILEIEEHTGIKKPLGREHSTELVRYMRENGYIDSRSKGTEKLAKALQEGTFELPERFTSLGERVKEKVLEVIKRKFDSSKVDIKNRDERVSVKVKKEALAGPFLELWEKIKYKTNYSISFDSEQFIHSAAEKLADELEVRLAKLEYMKASLVQAASGIDTGEQTVTSIEASKQEYREVPDIVSYLQHETKLTRKTIIAILKESGTLTDFKRNPQLYMMQTARILNAAKRLAMVDGVKYEKLPSGEAYDQQLFLQEELISYKDNTVEVKGDRSPFKHIIVDSEVERAFVKECEQDENVKSYIKLPSWFKVKTPLGPYNPDWAILLEKFGQERLYFIVETKGSTASEDIRPTELAKIKCGRKHFAALDTGVVFKKTTSERSLY